MKQPEIIHSLYRRMITQSLLGALIGAGNVTTFHMQGWEKIPRAEIVAIADPELERAGQRADEFGIDRTHIYTSLEDLLASEKSLDFVDIAAPPEAHLSLVELAAERKLHILLQKPFASHLSEACQMIDLAEAAGVTLSINENWRWRPWFRKIKQMLTEGTIGRPVYTRFFIHASGFFARVLPSDHRFRTWPRVALYDWGIHHIDILRFLFGDPQTVYMRTARACEQIQNGEDHAVAMLGYANGLTALVDISVASFAPEGHVNRDGPMVEDFRIEGDRGTLQLIPLAPHGTDLIRLTNAGRVNEWPAYEGEPYDAYVQSYITSQQHFIDCLLSGKTPETHAEENIKTLAATLAAYHSAETGQVVRIDDFKSSVVGN